MISPYDWQEAIGHRAQFVEARIATGVPVVAVSLDEGIVAATFRRQTRKVFEVYDRLMYAAIGQQSDVESLRVAAIDFAHREGFQRSEQDVTIQRVVTAMSQPIKEAFANFSSAPFVAKGMFMEVGEKVADDRYYCIDYDGDYSTDHRRACLAGTMELEEELEAQLSKTETKGRKAKDVVPELEQILVKTMVREGVSEADVMSGLSLEAALLARHKSGDRRFQLLTKEE